MKPLHWHPLARRDADEAAAPATVAEASGVAPDAIDEPRESETVGAA